MKFKLAGFCTKPKLRSIYSPSFYIHSISYSEIWSVYPDLPPSFDTDDPRHQSHVSMSGDHSILSPDRVSIFYFLPPQNFQSHFNFSQWNWFREIAENLLFRRFHTLCPPPVIIQHCVVLVLLFAAWLVHRCGPFFIFYPLSIIHLLSTILYVLRQYYI